VRGDDKDGNEIVREKPFEMGQSLKETSNLDIHKEMDLLERKIAELQAINANEQTIKFALKDYGMERFNKFLFCCFFLLAPSIPKYKQILLFSFIQFMMYMDHIHH